MRMPIVGFGVLFAAVSILILMRWPDPGILTLGVSAALVTILRLVVIDRYHKAGGSKQELADLTIWEKRYTNLTFLFAALLAGLNIRVLMVHEPLLLIGTVSLVFTFGAGIVSRTSCRPRLCTGSLLIAVLPTAFMMLWHAGSTHHQALHTEIFMLLGCLLLAVLGMSLDSVRHLYTAMLEQLVTKHDLAKLARYDALTGLPNRLMVREAYQSHVEAAQRTGTQLAIHYLDLDGFKAINDQFGHPVGDEMLRQVAARLLSTIRSVDDVFRLGGDEFVVMQASVNHRDEAELLARRIIKQLSDAYVIAAIEMRISVSIGISLACSVDDDLDELIAGADAALYRSKARGKSQLQFFEAGERLRQVASADLGEARRDIAGPSS
jgi:diguanylate cyclase (GGDEF)-like protein